MERVPSLRTMKRLCLTVVCLVFVAIMFSGPASAQCSAPEIVKGASKYNADVCKAYAAAKSGNQRESLRFFLAASRENLFESPNVLLFGDIAEAYAKLGDFKNADKYLKYDAITVLWMIGIVRCQRISESTDDEILLKDGKPLKSAEAKYMVNAVCGELYDDYSDFRDRSAESFVPAAKAILRYDAVRKKIDLMRGRQH
jgi:hypothetical protein